MSICVVICTAGPAEALERCHASILANTVQPLSILVVYGGDDREFLDRLRRLPDPTRVLWWPRAPFGCCHNFNLGLANGGTEWVAIIDDDAWLPPDWIEQMTSAARNEPAETAVLTTRFIEREIAETELLAAGYGQESHLCSFVEGGSLYRTSALATAGFFEPRLICYTVCRHASADLLNLGYRVKYLPHVSTFHDKEYGYRPSGFSISCHVRNWIIYLARYYSLANLLLLPWDLFVHSLRRMRPADVTTIDVSAHRLGHFGRSIRETPRGWLYLVAGLVQGLVNLPWALCRRKVCRHPDFKTFFGRPQR